MYLYIKKGDDFDTLPKELSAQFANPIFVMDLLLTKDKKLARDNVETVINNLNSKGFHLQLPPVWSGHQRDDKNEP